MTQTLQNDCRIADRALAPWGRREMKIAETEMPGLMAIREEYAAACGIPDMGKEARG